MTGLDIWSVPAQDTFNTCLGLGCGYTSPIRKLM